MRLWQTEISIGTIALISIVSMVVGYAVRGMA